MSKIKKLWGVSLLVLAFSMNANAQTCGIPPSCEALGYTQKITDCGSDTKALKCPLDLSKMFCAGNLSPATNCEIGDILYYDKTCSRKVIAGKTPIAIVFSEEKKLAVALDNIPYINIPWSPDGKFEDVTSLSDCIEGSACPNGKDNTKKIVAQYGSSTDYAAGYCANYSTSGTRSGDWFLPSISELRLIYNAKSFVNATLGLLDKKPLKDNIYWSSNEHSPYYSYMVNISTDNGSSSIYEKNKSGFVRPVMAF